MPTPTADPLTPSQWFYRWRDQDENHNFRTLARDWHSGQWSGFYRLGCAGGIVTAGHALDIYQEARRCLAQADADHPDRPALEALRDIADAYPTDEDDED